MAFLFVVHVPYVISSFHKPGFGNEIEASEEDVLCNDRKADGLETVTEEKEDTKSSSIDEGQEQDSIEGKEDFKGPQSEANCNIENDQIEHNKSNSQIVTESADEIVKSDAVRVRNFSKQLTEETKTDQESDNVATGTEATKVPEDENSPDIRTDKSVEDSEQNDDKSVGEIGRFDVIKVEESEVDADGKSVAINPEVSLDDKNDDSEKVTQQDTVDGVDGETEEKKEGENKTAETIEEKHLTPLIQVDPIHTVVIQTLASCDVENVLQQKVGQDGKILRISFVKADSKNCEDILNKLKAIGVGRTAGTSISVFPTTVHESSTEEDASQSYTSADEDENEPSEEAQEKESKFKKSIKSRLIVQQVVDSVRGNAEFTFDYLLLIILASLIACMGLVENSSVVLVASMLISPLMGPILAGTFGHVIKVYELRNLGVKSELKGLLICVLIGFLFGLISGGIGLDGAVWGSSDSWPTIEMKSRGMLRSLWVGMLIALPSGAGVAIGVLGGNAGSLVGVAISASLLPPAVNAGMLWAYALLTAIKPPTVIEPVITTTVINVSTTVLPNLSGLLNSTTMFSNISTTPPPHSTTSLPQPATGVPESCLPLVNNEYRQVYSCNISHDAALLGLVSLFLTMLNITCIFVMGIIVLKIKEVAPETAGTTTDFWHEDVKVARNYYETSKGPSSRNLGKKILEEWQKIKQEQQKKEISEEQKQLKQNVETISCVNYINDLENDPLVQRIMAKLSPSDATVAYLQDLAREYQKAKDHVNEQYRKDPSIYLSNYQPKARNKTVEKAYHTVHHVSPGPRRPTLAELRSRFKKGRSLYMDDIREGHSDTDISPHRKKKSSGFSLLSPTHSKLFARRKVKFEESEMEEGQKLV